MSDAVVTACGMATAIGLTAPAACAAFRARLDNFAETRFASKDGDWIFGAEVPLSVPTRGIGRLVDLLIGPLSECLVASRSDIGEVPVLICLPEKDRPGRLPELESELTGRLADRLGRPLHPASRTYAFGQVGGVVALRDAREMLAQGAAEVIVAGVDSLLVAETLRVFGAEDRLLTEANSNGFVAGEAGAAVLLVRGTAEPGLRIAGIGFGAERAHIASGEPLRADGMVKALREALAGAGATYDDISYRIADLAGEQFYFREAALAQTRLWRGKRDPEEVWLPADGMGHTGAAVIPICLGIGLTAMRKSYAPGPMVLIHAADDDGRRAAIVLRQDS